MDNKFGIILFVLSLVGLFFGTPTMTGNAVNEYFVGKFFAVHLIGLIFFFVSLIILASKDYSEVRLNALRIPAGIDNEHTDEMLEALQMFKTFPFKTLPISPLDDYTRPTNDYTNYNKYYQEKPNFFEKYFNKNKKLFSDTKERKPTLLEKIIMGIAEKFG